MIDEVVKVTAGSFRWRLVYRPLECFSDTLRKEAVLLTDLNMKVDGIGA